MINKDFVRVSDAGTARLTAGGSVVAERKWGEEKSVVEVHGWVRMLARERGKIVPGSHREGHNVWTNTGREYLAQRMTPVLPSVASTYRTDVIAYVKVGTGSQLEEPGVIKLQTPVEYRVGVVLAPIQAASFPLYPVRTTVQYAVVYQEDEISTGTSTVLVSELGLLTNGDPADNYNPRSVWDDVTEAKLLAPSAYKAFEPFGKTPAMQLELSWEIRF
jgi:hypothetical protein